MTDYRFGVFIGNLARLILVALPVTSVAMVLREAKMEGLHYSAVGMFLLVYLTALLPVAVGGAIHNAVAFSLPRRWPRPLKRVAAMVTSPVVLLLYVVGLATPDYLLLQSVPIVLGLLVYGFLFRIPADQLSAEGTPNEAVNERTRLE